MSIQVEAMRISLTEMHKSQLELVKLDNEEKAQAVAELEAQLGVMEEKLRHLQRETGGEAAEAGISSQSGLCYSPSCSGAGGDVCYSPSCLHHPLLPTVDINTATAEAMAAHTTSNVFDSPSTGAIISGMIDSNYNSTTDHTNHTGGVGLTTGAACYTPTTPSAASLSDIRLQSTLTGQNMDEIHSVHGYILKGCYSPTCFSGACYSPTCPNFRLYLEIIGSAASYTDVMQTSLVEHAPHSDSAALHDISICYSPSCANTGPTSEPDKSTICYSPSCLSRGSSEEGPSGSGDSSGGGDDGNKENVGERQYDDNSMQSGKVGGNAGLFSSCYSPSCMMEGTGCYSPSCTVRLGSPHVNQEDENVLLVNLTDENATSHINSPLNPFSNVQDNTVASSSEGQINWDMLGSITSLHDSLGGTLESSSHIVGTQETNPFSDFTQSVSSNPFADDLNPFVTNTGASQASGDMKPAVNPFEEGFDTLNFDPFATSKSHEPLVQSFASDFDPFTPQGTIEPLDRTRESQELIDVFGVDDKKDVEDSSTSELSDSVFASSGAQSLPVSEQSSARGDRSKSEEFDNTNEKFEQKDNLKVTPGSGNPFHGTGSLEDSGSIGFGSPFGTTTFGSEFGDLDHVRQYAKLMEERDKGSDEESSVEFGSDDNALDFTEATVVSQKESPEGNVELHSTKETEENNVEDKKMEEQKSDIEDQKRESDAEVTEVKSGTQNSEDMDGLMKTFDQLKLDLGSLGRTSSADLLDAKEPELDLPFLETETLNMPPEAEAGDSDFRASDTARTTSTYSYSSNPMSSRDFQETLDMNETGESHFSFEGGESHRSLHSQLSDADRSFSEAFHETQEIEDSDDSEETGHVPALGERQDSPLMLDAESGEAVRSGSDEGQTGLSSMETLPIREASDVVVSNNGEDEAMDIADDDLEYVETPRSDEYGAKPFEEEEINIDPEPTGHNDESDEMMDDSDDGHDDLQHNSNRNEADEVRSGTDDDVEYVETPRSDNPGEENKSIQEMIMNHNDQGNDEAVEITDDDEEYVETPRSDNLGEENKSMQEMVVNRSGQGIDDTVEITDDEVEYVEAPRSTLEAGQSAEEKDLGDSNENLGSDTSSREMSNAHQKLRRKSSMLGDEDVAGMSDVETNYIPSPKVGHGDDFRFDFTTDKTERVAAVSSSTKLEEMDLSSEDVESLDGKNELKTPKDYDRRLSNDGFEMDVDENHGVLFQSSAGADRREEEESGNPEAILDLENERSESLSSDQRRRTSRASSEDSIPEQISFESSSENTEEHKTEEDIGTDMLKTNVEADKDDLGLDPRSPESGNTLTVTHVEPDAADTGSGTGADEVMEISDDDIEYIVTPRTPRDEAEGEDGGSDSDSSATQDTVLDAQGISPDGEDGGKIQEENTRRASVLGDEDVNGMSDTRLDYIPSPRVGEEFDLGDSIRKSKDSATEENFVAHYADMDLSSEDMESLASDRELRTSQDYDRRSSNSGFEVDKDIDGGVLFRGSTSDETVEPKETEGEVLELENEETKSSSATSSPSKEKKTVTFGNTYALHEVGDEFMEVVLGDSVEFVRSSSEEENEEESVEKVKDEIDNVNSDTKFDSEPGEEVIVCSDTEYVETPREDVAHKIPTDYTEKDYNETTDGPREEGKDALDEERGSSLSEHDSISRSSVENSRGKEKTSSEESDSSDGSVSDDSLDDDTTSEKAMGKTYDIPSESDGQQSTSGSDRKEKRTKLSHEISTDESIPEEIEFESDEEALDADDEEDVGVTFRTMSSTVGDLGHETLDLSDPESFKQMSTIFQGEAADEKFEESELKVNAMNTVDKLEVKKEKSLSTTFVVQSLGDEAVEIDETEYVETPRDQNETPKESELILLDNSDCCKTLVKSPGSFENRSLYAESDSDRSDSEGEGEFAAHNLPEVDSVMRGEEEKQLDLLGNTLSSTIESAASKDELGNTYEVSQGAEDDVERQQETPKSPAKKLPDDDRDESSNDEIQNLEMGDKVVKEVDEPFARGEEELKSDHTFGATYKVDATEDEVIVDEDAEYVETPREEDIDVKKKESLSVSRDADTTPRSPGRVIGSMFAESDSEESDADSEDSIHDNSDNIDREQLAGDNQVLESSLRSTVGSETAEVTPYNDDKLGRTYEVLHGDDDDVEYIERWHDPSQTTTPTEPAVSKASTVKPVKQDESIEEIDTKDSESEKGVVDEDSGDDEEVEFLDDMIATKFYENSGVDQSLDLSGPKLDVRSLVEMTSDEQVMKDTEDYKADEIIETVDEVSALDRSDGNVFFHSGTVQRESSSGLGLSSILASNILVPGDVVFVSVIQDDFELSQNFPHQSTQPKIVEISDENELIEGTGNQNNETLESEVPKQQELTSGSPDKHTPMQNETMKDSSDHESTNYNLSMQIKDVIVDKHPDSLSPMKIEQLLDSNSKSDKFSLETKDAIEDIEEGNNEMSEATDEQSSNKTDDSNDGLSLTFSVDGKFDLEQEPNYEGADNNDFSMEVKEVIESDDMAQSDIEGSTTDSSEEMACAAQEGSGDFDEVDVWHPEDTTGEKSTVEDTELHDILPEVKSFVELVVQRACDTIVNIESQKFIEAIEEDVERESEASDSSTEIDQVSEEHVEKENATITGFNEAPYAATLNKNNKDTDTLIEGIIAVDSHSTALKTPPSIVTDEYQVDSDAEHQNLTSAGIGKKKPLNNLRTQC